MTSGNRSGSRLFRRAAGCGPAATGPLLILAALLLALDVWGGVPGRPFPPGWLGGVIPYVLDEDMPDRARQHAGQAMAGWAEATVLRFVPRTDEPDFIYFVEGGQYQNCVRQPTCVGVGGFAPNNEHGLGHGLGLAHEQQRRDRDRYIRVFQESISSHWRSVWNPRSHYGGDISPYNYQSVMHYGFLSSKWNRRDAPAQMETIPPHMPAGQIAYADPSGEAATIITPGDADTVARMVGLTPESWTISTNPLGLTVVVDGEEVTTPAVFDWTPGSEHTLSVPSPQAQPGSRYRFGRWSDDGVRARPVIGRTRTVVATSDVTLYEANFIAAHRVSTRVRPEGAGTVTISPNSPDGYYPLRSPITMSAEPAAGSGFRFLRWEIRSDYGWGHQTHGASANPARTYALPGLTYTAIFTREPIFGIESNADPTPVVMQGGEYFTPVAFAADSLPERVAVALGKESRFWHDKGYRDRFRSWSDGGDESHAVSVSPSEDTLLALTVDTDYRLVTHHPLHGDGEVVATPSSDDGFYPEGTEVRLLATAVPPREFIGWNGDVSGSDPAALVVMDGGKLAEAVVDLPERELQSGVPVDVALEWTGERLDYREHYVRVPADAGEVEIRFQPGGGTPGAEAGLFVFTRGHQGPNSVRHEDAHGILRAGEVGTLTIPRPPDRWPAAYFILVRAAESTGGGSRNLEGTLVARVRGGGDINRAPQAVGTLEDRTLTTDGGPLVLNVASAFRDPDGDVLTYRAISSSPGVAAVSVWYSTVTVTPTAVGTTTVTATATDPGGLNAVQSFRVTVTPPANRPFTDHPIVPGVTPVRAVHFTELRTRIDGLRAGAALTRYPWTDRVLRAGVTPVRLVHLAELRTALTDAYRAAGRPAPRWTDVGGGGAPIRAAHVTELRAAVVVLESSLGSTP